MTDKHRQYAPPALRRMPRLYRINPLNPELNPIYYLLALLGAHHFLHVSRIRVKSLTLRRLMSYIYIYIYIYTHTHIYIYIYIYIYNISRLRIKKLKINFKFNFKINLEIQDCNQIFLLMDLKEIYLVE